MRLGLGFDPMHHRDMADAQQTLNAAKTDALQIELEGLLLGTGRMTALIALAKRAAAIPALPTLPAVQAFSILNNVLLLTVWTFHALVLTGLWLAFNIYLAIPEKDLQLLLDQLKLELPAQGPPKIQAVK